MYIYVCTYIIMYFEVYYYVYIMYACIYVVLLTVGADQGLHNWLVYSGHLARYVDVTMYPQGDGPVNTLGGFFGLYNKKFFNLTLTDMKIIRGKPPNMVFYNWDGMPSAVIHQYDRF